MTAIGAMKTPSTERGCMPHGAKNELTSFGRPDDCASTSPFDASSTNTRPLLDSIHTWPFSMVAVPTWRPGGGGVNCQSSAPDASSNPTTGNPTSGDDDQPVVHRDRLSELRGAVDRRAPSLLAGCSVDRDEILREGLAAGAERGDDESLVRVEAGCTDDAAIGLDLPHDGAVAGIERRQRRPRDDQVARRGRPAACGCESSSPALFAGDAIVGHDLTHERAVVEGHCSLHDHDVADDDRSGSARCRSARRSTVRCRSAGPRLQRAPEGHEHLAAVDHRRGAGRDRAVRVVADALGIAGLRVDEVHGPPASMSTAWSWNSPTVAGKHEDAGQASGRRRGRRSLPGDCDRCGWKAVGLEPAAERNREDERGFRIIAGTVDDLDPAERYDVITLWDVVEHVDDPRGLIEKCVSLLTLGGI